MPNDLFHAMFQGPAMERLIQGLDQALAEDGRDLTSEAVFGLEDQARAEIVAKQEAVAAGLPLLPLVLERARAAIGARAETTVRLLVLDGDAVAPGLVAAFLEGPARVLLLAERTALNFVTHLSGVATLTRAYVRALGDSRTRLLDTRKTLPGLRLAEKYAVRLGGGENHRLDLAEMCMLKDNHIDRAGGIAPAVSALRAALCPCPPIEVECRTLDEVRQAAALGVFRIMLDNMDPATMRQALALIPPGIQSEISGNVDLSAMAELGRLGADFISVGRITHSAPAADFSLRVIAKK